jgi:hypothetical protein
MSRIPAHGAVVVTTTISAVLALCLLGGIAAEASAGTAAASPASSAVAKTATTVDTTNDDTLSLASSASPLSSSFVPSAPDEASFTSSFDAAQSVDTTANVGLAGLAAEGQVSVPLTAPASAAAPAAVAVAVQTTKPAAVTGTPREIAHTLASSRGWSAAQWTCLDKLWQRESKFQPTIRNSRSGAYGIPQALPASRMASAGADWRTNPVTQVKWGLTYISTRYGTGCNAWAHWQRHGWY